MRSQRLESRLTRRAPRWPALLAGCGLLVGLAPAPTVGAATLGAAGTVSSSKPVSRPPFYRGELPAGPAAVAHLPVGLAEPGPGLPEPWLPTAALERLVDDLNGWLERSGRTRLLPPFDTGRRSAPPTIYLGCSPEETLPEECAEDPRQNVLVTTSGNKEWRARLGAAARQAGVERVLVLELRIAPHWVYQRNLKGAKEVRLGTGYAQPLAWLTSLDTPVYVLQVSGVAVDAEGRVLRGGVEGLWALRTPFRASMLRAQKLLRDEDVDFVRTELRRDDLPGAPRVWEAAVEQLVAQLAGPELDRPTGSP